MYLIISTAIPTIDIREERRSNVHVVHTRIEYLLLLGGSSIDTNLRNLAIPLIVCLLARSIELGSGNLRIEVELCTLGTHRR